MKNYTQGQILVNATWLQRTLQREEATQHWLLGKEMAQKAAEAADSGEGQAWGQVRSNGDKSTVTGRAWFDREQLRACRKSTCKS